MHLTRRHALTLIASAAVLPLLTACEEPKDCDADDRREGDPDCRTSKPKSKPRPRRR